MWVPQQLPEIAGTLKKAGLKLNPKDLANLTGDPMGAVVSLGGCTASFVSPQGLVITNHHCAYGAIQLNSTPDKNLIDRRLQRRDARRRTDRRAERARSTRWNRSRTSATASRPRSRAAPDALARANALDGIEKQLVSTCEAGGGYRCRLYSFAGGNTYRLFKNLEIRDVRLVYAPPGSIGNYGGEIDNWMWPRHTGDFSFYRAYVGKDGKPAAYSRRQRAVPAEALAEVRRQAAAGGRFRHGRRLSRASPAATRWPTSSTTPRPGPIRPSPGTTGS